MFLNVHDDKPSYNEGTGFACFGVAFLYRRWTCSCCLCMLEFGLLQGSRGGFVSSVCNERIIRKTLLYNGLRTEVSKSVR